MFGGILSLGGFYPAKSIAHAGGLGHGEYFDPKKDFELENPRKNLILCEDSI